MRPFQRSLNTFNNTNYKGSRHDRVLATPRGKEPTAEADSIVDLSSNTSKFKASVEKQLDLLISEATLQRSLRIELTPNGVRRERLVCDFECRLCEPRARIVHPCCSPFVLRSGYDPQGHCSDRRRCTPAPMPQGQSICRCRRSAFSVLCRRRVQSENCPPQRRRL